MTDTTLHYLLCIPIATINVSSLPKVGGDAVSYFDPYDKLSMEEAVRKIIDNKEYRRDLIVRSLEQARKFSCD